MSLRFLSAIALCLAACSGARTSGTRVRATAVRFVCEPRDATLVVDETNYGQCILWERRYMGLTAGPHRLRVERDGFLLFEQELTSTANRATVTVTLRPRPE